MAITVKEIISNVTPSERIIMSKRGDFNFVDQTGNQSKSMKPRGLWYAVGSEWLKFVSQEYHRGFGSYIYKIEINPSSMIMINNDRSFIDFADKYGVHDDHLASFMGRDGAIMNIDWTRVASDYSGIEISPYLWDFRLSNHMWYYGWDVASGCIWGEDVINDYELLHSEIESLPEVDNSWYGEDVDGDGEVK